MPPRIPTTNASPVVCAGVRSAELRRCWMRDRLMSYSPMDSSTAAATSRNARGPETRWTRTTAPIATPGSVPVSKVRVSGPVSCPARRYLHNAPGPEMMLYSRLVGVTAGLATCSRSSCTGNRNTAPETPTGAVTVAMNNPATKPSSNVTDSTPRRLPTGRRLPRPPQPLVVVECADTSGVSVRDLLAQPIKPLGQAAHSPRW